MACCFNHPNYDLSHTNFVCASTLSSILCKLSFVCDPLMFFLSDCLSQVDEYNELQYCSLQVTPLSWAEWRLVLYLSFPVCCVFSFSLFIDYFTQMIDLRPMLDLLFWCTSCFQTKYNIFS